MAAPSSEAALPVPADIVEIEKCLTRVAYLAGRARQHEYLMAMAGLTLDRAAVAILRRLAETEPMRPGVLAGLLAVEASHVTRQVQQLERAGYVVRAADPHDRRAQRLELTEAGRAAVDRFREASRVGMRMALADWSDDDLRRLAELFHRLVDDFVTHAEVAADPALGLSAPTA
ncbi:MULTISPECIES: MarR family transcriptional regulator [unclassified Streptomyces]|uniref:MarR family winged helix-turn-helix transcriptional regulator n=1 Tax=unclassified Streptomyces TaxID=2593676 RepID=UPI002366C584|nr:MULTISPECIES: MarR family transcriptional regulator [unclassified Streptomyces]MDF3142515.1 MarR family transcriptional regulator [Streptomyces sp. T21Q-yed]WDF39777.1 MarR family transcriptional regulator [Streptomyces sp. T12]